MSNGDDWAVVLAGGKGSRLRPYTAVLPKPLIPVGDVPILEVVIHQLRRCGIRRLILAVNHKDNLIRSYFGDGETFGVQLRYSKEDRPLGTIGPVLKVADQLPESFLVLNGDVLTDLDFRACLEAHRRWKGALTLSVYRRRVGITDGVVEIDADGMVTSFREKPVISVWASMGVYAVTRSVLTSVPRGQAYGMDELVLGMLKRGETVNTFRHQGQWYDIGSPEDLERANEAFAARRKAFLELEDEPIPAEPIPQAVG